MTSFGWDYPPGVTGNEPQITGEWRCAACGAVLPEEVDGEPFEGEECPGGCYEPDYDSIRGARDERRADEREAGDW